MRRAFQFGMYDKKTVSTYPAKVNEQKENQYVVAFN